MPRIGTLPLAVPAACGSSFCVQSGALRPADLHIGTTGSRVPTSSLDRARATYMPDTAWTVSRFPPDFSRGCQTGLGSDVIFDSRHLAGGLSTSPSRSLPDTSHDAFSAHVHHDRLLTDAARGGLEPSLQDGSGGPAPICWPASNSTTPIYVRGTSFVRGTPWLSQNSAAWLTHNSLRS